MVNPLTLTVTLGSFYNKHIIYLPNEDPVQNPNDLKIKFYNRGKYVYRSTLRTGKLTTPRNDTQIYINNKYFFVINAILTEEVKQRLETIIKYCYMYGLSVEEIKQEFKIAYGRVWPEVY